MDTVRDVLAFRIMVSPVVLQVLFWAGIGGTLYGAYVLLRMDHWAWWLALLFGSLATRVIVERAIIAFRTYDLLNEIAAATRK